MKHVIFGSLMEYVKYVIITKSPYTFTLMNTKLCECCRKLIQDLSVIDSINGYEYDNTLLSLLIVIDTIPFK